MDKVLIVDDELAIVETLTEILGWAGYQVLAASNGQEGLRELGKKPDVVVLDFMMPVMDGLQMLRAMRADARYRKIPVILMSAAGLDTVRAAARLAGRRSAPWDAFVAKPFEPDTLLAAISVALRRRTQ
jgi:CheY-like chemotaxis protein